MGAGHSHGERSHVPTPQNIRVILAACVAPFALAVVIGLIVLWPAPAAPPPDAEANRIDLFDANVVSSDMVQCALSTCQAVVVEPTEGPEIGRRQQLPDFALESDVPFVNIGDAIVVQRAINPGNGEVTYNFADVQRTSSLMVLGLIFAVVVIAIARLRGVAALVGLGFSYFVIVRFLLPALLAGESPVAVALVASGAIMFVILYLAHGVNARTTTAVLGTMVSLVLIGVLAQVFVYATKLTGLTSDEATYLKTQVGNVDLRGILLAGIIIGALGVLNDVTVTQASAVWEIHDANPARGVRKIYSSGMRVGRDHIASTVDTLVLAYAGASLPLFIVFSLGARPFTRIVTGGLVAEEIVRTLVGSIGLVASVPLTTAIAALVVTRSTAIAATADVEPDASEGDEAEPSVVPTRQGTIEVEEGELDADESDAAGRPGSMTTWRPARPPKPPKTYRAPKAERDFWGDDGPDD